ncbi:MAG: hypothetical protein H0T39_00080 [Actinobacteria bacterium]|nr:hypothetical protein [Actinomycetota bacterium]
MLRKLRWLVLAFGVLGVIGPGTASADHRFDEHSENMQALGESLRSGSFTDPIGWDTRNTDLAFWGDRVIQGRYDGFRIIDIAGVRAPSWGGVGNPKEVAFFPCVSPQGDVGVWGDLVFRSVDSGTRTDQCQPFLDQQTPGFEGIQIFDISDVNNIQQIASVPLDCGSHTHTVVPDLENNRVLLYNSNSGSSNIAPSAYGNRCTADHGRFDIVEVPLDNPSAAHVIGAGMLGTALDGRVIRACHDIGVILGDVNRAACAGNPLTVVFDISDPANPVRLFDLTSPTVTSFHASTFTWDGKYLVLGWEPGGGPRPRCQETGAVDEGVVVTDEMKTIFFHDATTGELVGRWVLPRPQSAFENCTIHNFNVLPIRGRYVLVHGSYQSGTSMVDFTDPTNAYEVAFSDPAPLEPGVLSRGGVWTSTFYNGLIYESDTRRGLRIYRVRAREAAGALRLPHLNPATSEFSLP